MKKITGILFLLVYLSALTGWSASIHTCGGTVSSVSLFSHHHVDQDCCCSKMDCDCCSDYKVEAKQHKDHESQSKTAIDLRAKSNAFVALPAGSFVVSFTGELSFTSNISHIPPLISKQPVYLRNMVFQI